MRRQPTLRFAPPDSMTPTISRLWRKGCARGWRRSIFNRRLSSPPSTACRNSRSTRAIPTEPIAKLRGDCCARRWGCQRQLGLSFQSRFGRAKWLEPYTADTVAELAKSGVKRLAMIAPGFSANCPETIEELGVDIRDLFLGGRRGESRGFLVSTTARRGCGCLRRWRGANWRDGHRRNSPPTLS